MAGALVDAMNEQLEWCNVSQQTLPPDAFARVRDQASRAILAAVGLCSSLTAGEAANAARLLLNSPFDANMRAAINLAISDKVAALGAAAGGRGGRPGVQQGQRCPKFHKYIKEGMMVELRDPTVTYQKKLQLATDLCYQLGLTHASEETYLCMAVGLYTAASVGTAAHNISHQAKISMCWSLKEDLKASVRIMRTRSRAPWHGQVVDWPDQPESLLHAGQHPAVYERSYGEGPEAPNSHQWDEIELSILKGMLPMRRSHSSLRGRTRSAAAGMHLALSAPQVPQLQFPQQNPNLLMLQAPQQAPAAAPAQQLLALPAPAPATAPTTSAALPPAPAPALPPALPPATAATAAAAPLTANASDLAAATQEMLAVLKTKTGAKKRPAAAMADAADEERAEEEEEEEAEEEAPTPKAKAKAKAKPAAKIGKQTPMKAAKVDEQTPAKAAKIDKKTPMQSSKVKKVGGKNKLALPYPGVPKVAKPPVEYRQWRVYTDTKKQAWRAKEVGVREDFCKSWKSDPHAAWAAINEIIQQ